MGVVDQGGDSHLRSVERRARTEPWDRPNIARLRAFHLHSCCPFYCSALPLEASGCNPISLHGPSNAVPPGNPPMHPPHGDELSPHYTDVGLGLSHHLTTLKPCVKMQGLDCV